MRITNGRMRLWTNRSHLYVRVGKTGQTEWYQIIFIIIQCWFNHIDFGRIDDIYSFKFSVCDRGQSVDCRMSKFRLRFHYACSVSYWQSFCYLWSSRNTQERLISVHELTIHDVNQMSKGKHVTHIIFRRFHAAISYLWWFFFDELLRVANCSAITRNPHCNGVVICSEFL